MNLYQNAAGIIEIRIITVVVASSLSAMFPSISKDGGIKEIFIFFDFKRRNQKMPFLPIGATKVQLQMECRKLNLNQIEF